jgi:hypothetical protein
MIRNILLVFLLIASIATTAQRTNSSPYSFFGIGEEFSPQTVEQSAMGGIGVAFSHYKYLNFSNPAAYANLRYTTYSFGVLNNKLTIDTGDKKQSTSSTSLSYFALAFPIGSKAGMSFGIQPVSSVGYSLTNTNETETEISVFSGDGGVSRIYGSFGIKVLKGFSLGFEADYSFGSIENSITNQIFDVSLATKYKESTIVRGGTVTVGAQYEKEVKKDIMLTAGATFKAGDNLNVTGNEYLYSLSFTSSGGEFGRDTISQSSISAKYKIPLKTTLGVGLGKFDKWYVGVEYASQDAIETNGFLTTTNSAYKYGSSNRFSLGGFYIPKINSISSYWERVTYRAGVRFKKTGLLVDGSGLNNNFTPVDDFGISFGLGLPLRQLSSVNMGFEFGKRGTTTNNLIQENYFNFRLSLSLTDSKWFQKRKID